MARSPQPAAQQPPGRQDLAAGRMVCF